MIKWKKSGKHFVSSAPFWSARPVVIFNIHQTYIANLGRSWFLNLEDFHNLSKTPYQIWGPFYRLKDAKDFAESVVSINPAMFF